MSIGIIGGGLAGLTTAYRLARRGISSVIYEASERLGGRVRSATFENGQVYEKGGEYIDSDHREIRRLIQTLGLRLVVADAGGNDIYQVIDYDAPENPYVPYTYQEASADYRIIYNQISSDAWEAYPGKSFVPNDKSRELDQLSVEEYIDRLCSVLRPDGDGAKSKFAQCLKVAYTIQFGAEPKIQSSLNLVFMLGFGKLRPFNWFGPSDEKYNVLGGCERLVDRLKEEIDRTGIVEIYLNTNVTEIERLPDKSYELTTSRGKRIFRRIVSAVPFSQYQINADYSNPVIDISKAQLSPLKLYTIQNLKMNNNAKFNIQFRTKFWRNFGLNGNIYSTSDPRTTGTEESFQNTWDVSADQPEVTGILCNYTGGNYALKFETTESMPRGKRMAYTRAMLNDFLSKLEPIIPGGTDQVIEADIINWSDNQWVRGSYSLYTIGQYASGETPFAGTEWFAEPREENSVRDRNFHFAGEQTEFDFQGYLEGAIVSGNRVADEIISNL
jgi:monoamine oxidase